MAPTINILIVFVLITVASTAKTHINQKATPTNKSDKQLNVIADKTVRTVNKISKVVRPVYAERDNLTSEDTNDEHLHEVYTVEYPASCTCRIEEGLNPGTCYRFLQGSTTRCAPHKCNPSFVCVVGLSTGLTCMRKVITSKITSNSDGTCKKTATQNFAYVPYSE